MKRSLKQFHVYNVDTDILIKFSYEKKILIAIINVITSYIFSLIFYYISIDDRLIEIFKSLYLLRFINTDGYSPEEK